MNGVNSQRRMVPGLQGSQRITTAQKWVEKYPLWQNLMDKAFGLWENDDWNYHDFLMNLDSQIRRFVILGNFNNQVDNGGFEQWVGNDYFNTNIRTLIFDAFKNIKLDAVAKAFELVKEMDIILERNYSYAPIIKDYVPDNKRLISTFDSERYYGDDFDAVKLDDRYYKISDQFCYEIEKYLINNIQTNGDYTTIYPYKKI